MVMNNAIVSFMSERERKGPPKARVCIIEMPNKVQIKKKGTETVRN